MKIACIIPFHSNYVLLQKCLSSLFDAITTAKAIDTFRYEVIVVNNGKVDLANIYGDYSDIELDSLKIINMSNRGFGAAVNMGVANSSGDVTHILVVNSDIEFKEKFFDFLKNISSVEKSFVGFYSGGKNEEKPIVCLHSLKTRYGDDLIASERFYISCFLAFLPINEFVRVGGFDETFFMYCEDIELSYRLFTSGVILKFIQTNQYVHLGSASFKNETKDHKRVFLARSLLSLANKLSETRYRTFYIYWTNKFIIRNLLRLRLRTLANIIMYRKFLKRYTN